MHGALEEEWEEEMNHEVVEVASKEVEVAAAAAEEEEGEVLEIKFGEVPVVVEAAEVVQATEVEVKPAAGETPGATKDTNNGINQIIHKVVVLSYFEK